MMNIEEALVVLDAALEDNVLNNIQELVFRQAWEGKTYSEIAENCGYEANYIKNVGYKLWSLLSTVFTEEVTKSNFRVVIRRYYYEKFKMPRSPHMVPESHADQVIFDFHSIDNLVENAKFSPTERVANANSADVYKTRHNTPIKATARQMTAKNVDTLSPWSASANVATVNR